MQRETGFCVECRDVTSYTLQKKLVKKMIRGEELTFEILVLFVIDVVNS